MLGSNFLGIYEKAFASEDSWPIRFTKAKKCGFDYLEISIDEDDSRLQRLWWTRDQKRELRNYSWDAGVPIFSMCLSGHRRFPFGSADTQKAAKALEIIDRAVEFASELGIRVIQLAGYDVYYEPSTERSRNKFFEGLQHTVQKAAQYQVMTAMEIMDTDFYNSITKHLQFEKELNSPWFKVYPDIGNLTAWGNDVNVELKKGIGSIVCIHLKDTLAVTKDFPGKFKCVPFGSGCVNFAGLFDTMRKLNYQGPYMIEMWHQPDQSDVETVIQARQFIEAKYAERIY